MPNAKLLASVNPYTGETFSELVAMDEQEIDTILAKADATAAQWADTSLDERSQLMHQVADYLDTHRDHLAEMITREMGKLLSEARSEVEKCSWVCRYYANRAAGILADQDVATDAKRRSAIVYQPLGIILAVMPWNFPLWQVFRFAAPTLMAGNVALLKHASNVSLCANAIEGVFREVGFPEGAFNTLLIGASQVESVIRDPRVKAVTLTGSEPAGKAVASVAASELKKSVLELGGSDPFIVLDDANLVLTVQKAVASRFMNAGQSCIAAKRFIVQDSIADKFVAAFSIATKNLKYGDPMSPDTTLAPMVRADLRDELHEQVQDALEKGATAVLGCEPIADSFSGYPASILDHVTPAMRAYHEELFGPVATIIRVADEEEAIAVANSSDFGLGGSVWTERKGLGERIARRLECGCAFVNELVKSDPRLPFGGVKRSGFGRELAEQGMMEFVNIKTLWVD